MMPVRYYILAILSLATCATFRDAFAQSDAWDRYVNPRFGYSALYPADIFRPGKESANGDGGTFISADGRSKLTVFAAYNAENMGLMEYRATILREFAGYNRVEYGPAGATWFVLSGERGDSIYYQKVVFSCGGRVINAFALTYPEEEKRAFDPIVTTIEKNFRAVSGPACDGASR